MTTSQNPAQPPYPVQPQHPDPYPQHARHYRHPDPVVPRQRAGWDDAPKPPERSRRIPMPVILIAVFLLGATGGFLAGRQFPTEGAVQRYVINAMAEAWNGGFPAGGPAGLAGEAAANVGETAATPIPPSNYKLSLTGSAKSANINWSYGGSSGSDRTGVPWEKKVSVDNSNGMAGTVSISGVTDSGAAGDLTCTITDTDTGAVLKTQTAQSDGGDYGYASVSCYLY